MKRLLLALVCLAPAILIARLAQPPEWAGS